MNKEKDIPRKRKIKKWRIYISLWVLVGGKWKPRHSLLITEYRRGKNNGKNEKAQRTESTSIGEGVDGWQRKAVLNV